MENTVAANTIPGEVASLLSGKRILHFLLAIFQLWALFFLIGEFKIEKDSGLFEIRYVVLVSFAVTAFLHKALRPFVFFCTSLFIIYYAFGLFSGSVLVLGAFFLFGLCHLPVKIGLRIFLIVGFMVGMFILRADLFYAPRAALIVPFLASMFIFRIAVYLYDNHYQKFSLSVFQRLNYFFLFPNYCFPLFPIVDFKTSQKNYYSIPDSECWQKGICWMLKGIACLLAYKFVYYLLFIPSTEVRDLSSFLHYCISNYALTLRLLGMFHLIVGLLCVFGYDLPPVFNNYFLATGFTDLWRRINIYWRDFMMKLFFYPVIFKIKKYTEKYALPLTMLCMFLLTWLLHDYQYFWLRGSAPTKLTDVLFWMIIGIGITVNAMLEERKLLKGSHSENKYAQYFFTMLKICGMFLFMSLMWSLWNSATLDEWFFLLSKAGIFNTHQLLKIVSVILLLILLGIFIQIIGEDRKLKKLLDTAPQKTFYLTLFSVSGILLVLQLRTSSVLPTRIASLVSILSDQDLNENEKRIAESNYYKNIMDGEGNVQNRPWEASLNPRKHHTSVDDLVFRSHDFLYRKLKPSMYVKVDNYILQTNNDGLRDKEYARKKPTNVYRIALLGGSYELGAGVNNNEIFEGLTEEKLNANNGGKKFEILNFAMYRYHILQQVDVCNTRVFDFEPDAVMYFTHTGETARMNLVLTEMIINKADLKYSFLKNIVSLSGSKQTMSTQEISERLTPFNEALVRWGYLQIAALCRQHGTQPIWVFLPTTNDRVDVRELNTLEAMAQKLGFITIDLQHVYGNQAEKLLTSATDPHPNAKGHRLIADSLCTALIKKQILFGKLSQ